MKKNNQRKVEKKVMKKKNSWKRIC